MVFEKKNHHSKEERTIFMITWRFMKITKILALEYFELYSIVAISSGSFQVTTRVPSWGGGVSPEYYPGWPVAHSPTGLKLHFTLARLLRLQCL